MPGLPPTLPLGPAAAARAPRGTMTGRPQAPLSAAERSQIADAFPPRPAVAQTLYGADRQVQQARPLGARLDLSA